jgi:3-hydroxy-9,10-secoandrosta-1,3,5(10)-triene-9,17-dione monooxygenase reductase component
MVTITSSELDPRTLRNALGRYATGVVVVTTRSAEGTPRGLTVNSFTSVSLDPPLVLFCVVTRSNGYAAWESAEHFAINILASDQRRISNTFAKPSTAQWNNTKWRAGRNGCALIDSAIASIECRRFAHHPGGDHLVILGEVTAIHLDDCTDPLLFHGGRYGTYWPSEHGEPPADSTLSDLVLAGFG